MRQTGYQVIVASRLDWLGEGMADLWDSGKVSSAQSFGVEYGSYNLTSELNAFWQVRIWDETGRPSAWSRPATFRMGLLGERDWEAKWIGQRPSRYRGASNGYHALESKIDVPKWVQVDLGESLAVGQVLLFPAKPDNWKPVTSGFGFPQAGRVEVSDEADFSHPTLLSRWDDGAALVHGDGAVKFDGDGARGRYVRVTAEHLWRRQDGVFCFALGELRVMVDGKNRALGAPVSALDSVENTSGWAMRGLTDGRAAGIAPDPDEFAAVLLRKSFAVTKPVSRATLSVCGLGYCIPEINGRRVGDAELDPGFTAFDRRILYVTHDVTGQVRKGENVIRLTLGGGWFDLATPDLFGFEQAPWNAPPRALARLKIEFADGTAQVVVSDESWETGTGPIQFQCVRGGESVDFTRPEQWRPALLVKAPAGKLQAQAHPPIQRAGEIPAIELTEPKPGIYQFKLAENTSGWPRLRARGVKGQKITLRCAEDFEPNGAISRNLNSHTFGRYQTEEFVMADDREHQLEPHFTYHGFQYVRVEGLRRKPRLEDLAGVAVHTMLEPAGSFACSDPLLNRIHAMCVRTYLNNLHGIPTDCPQREKEGWTLDGYVASVVGMWNFRSDTFYDKWARDMGDSQAEDGSVPSLMPNPGWWGLLDPWWGGSCATLPWELHERYGDIRVLREQFPVMKKYVDYAGTRARDNLVDFSLGDWLEAGSGGPANRTPVEITSSLAYFNCARIVGQTAGLLGDAATAAEYLALSEKIRSALNRKYFDKVHHRYAADSQSASAMSLVLGLAPEEERPAVFAELLRNIAEDRHNHVSTGIVGTRFLFEALHAGGRDDVAYAILMQPDFPGWVNMLNHGATTVWESWEGGNSRDHPALSVVDAWLYEAVGGITPEPGAMAFDRITIAPQVVGGLTWARASHDTIRGRIESRWQVEGKKFKLKIAVPVGTRANVIVPSRDGPQHYECGSGSYIFNSVLK
jgi:alpha-L-rhamnosidase